MSFESKLYLVNPILASSPRIDIVVHIFGSADIFSLWYRLIKEWAILWDRLGNGMGFSMISGIMFEQAGSLFFGM